MTYDNRKTTSVKYTFEQKCIHALSLALLLPHTPFAWLQLPMKQNPNPQNVLWVSLDIPSQNLAKNERLQINSVWGFRYWHICCKRRVHGSSVVHRKIGLSFWGLSLALCVNVQCNSQPSSSCRLSVPLKCLTVLTECQTDSVSKYSPFWCRIWSLKTLVARIWSH